MSIGIKMVELHRGQGNRQDICSFNPEQIKKVQQFHASFPMYQPTPLVSMPDTAKELGLGSLYVKESPTGLG